MPNTSLPTGPAPTGFWKEPEAEGLLATVILAMVSKSTIAALDMSKVARIVGEGKLSKKSARAKLTQLVVRGRQRIADSETRLRADDENAAQRDTTSDGPAVRDDTELDNTDSQPPALKPRKRKRNAADALLDSTEHRRKQKKVNEQRKEQGKKKSRSEEKSRSKKKARSKEKFRNRARNASNPSISQVATEPGARHATQELNSMVDDRSSDPLESTADLQVTRIVKREVGHQSGPQPNPALQSKGLSKDSAIEIDGDDEMADEHPVSRSRNAGRMSLPLRGARRPLQPVKNGANVQNPSKVIKDKTAQEPTTIKWFMPSGRLHRTQVAYRSRHWQAPYMREISIVRER